MLITQKNVSTLISDDKTYTYTKMYKMMAVSITMNDRTILSTHNMYTVNHKKRDTLILTITLAKLNRFL